VKQSEDQNMNDPDSFSTFCMPEVSDFTSLYR